MNIANVNPDGNIEWLGDDGVVNSNVKEAMAGIGARRFWPQKVCTKKTGCSGTSTNR